MCGHDVIDSKTLRYVGNERTSLIWRKDHPASSSGGQIGSRVNDKYKHGSVDRDMGQHIFCYTVDNSTEMFQLP